jgi:hypothetical protein
MSSEELMVKNPICFTVLLDVLTNDLAIHVPFSNQLIQQPILEDAMLTVNFHR